MSSRKYSGIRFSAYSNDHPPRHVHGKYEGTVVVVDLLENGNVALANRKDAIRPASGKRSTVKKILLTAVEHHGDLVALWEEVHDYEEQK